MTVKELKEILKDVPDNTIVTTMSCPSDNLMKDDYDIENVVEYIDRLKLERFICLYWFMIGELNMSKAVICDRCKKAFSEQTALHIEGKWQFIITHYDLCPKCHGEFKEFMKNDKEMESKDEDNWCWFTYKKPFFRRE